MPTDTTKTGESLSEPISFREIKEEGEGRTGPDKTNGQGRPVEKKHAVRNQEYRSQSAPACVSMYLCGVRGSNPNRQWR